MREILFRGKHMHSGKWLYADLFYDNMGEFMYFINPETLGQYTCSLDKYGRQIFEGDIVKSSAFHLDDPVVRFANSAFTIDSGLELVKDVLKNIEVIGNIHDNPKLVQSIG